MQFSSVWTILGTSKEFFAKKIYWQRKFFAKKTKKNIANKSPINFVLILKKNCQYHEMKKDF